jgi:hypothetical protein
MWILVLIGFLVYLLFLWSQKGFSPRPQVQIFPTNREYFSEAGDPITPPERLQTLAIQRNPAIRRLVASNPNTPNITLRELLPEFPYEVLENPVFPLIQLENPAFVVEMDYVDMLKILDFPDLPRSFIDSAVYHRSSQVISKILQRPDVTAANLEILVNNVSDESTASQVISHINCTNEIKKSIAYHGNSYLQTALAKKCLQDISEIAPELLEILADHAAIDIQSLMVMHPNITESLLDRLLSNDKPALQQRIAFTTWSYIPYHARQRTEFWYDADRPRVPYHVQLRLVYNQVPDIAYRIAIRQTLADGEIDQSILDLLSSDPYAKVRSTVATLANLPTETLFRLAQDKSDRVQRRLLKNADISSELLVLMAQNEDLRMRELVAQHPNTPIEVLKTLANDPQLQGQLARNPRTLIEILTRLAEQGTQDIALTQNPKIPDAIVQPILAKLSQDRRYTVRKLVARYPQTPQVILEQLANEPEPKVNRIAQQRLNS